MLFRPTIRQYVLDVWASRQFVPVGSKEYEKLTDQLLRAEIASETARVLLLELQCTRPDRNLN